MCASLTERLVLPLDQPATSITTHHRRISYSDHLRLLPNHHLTISTALHDNQHLATQFSLSQHFELFQLQISPLRIFAALMREAGDRRGGGSARGTRRGSSFLAAMLVSP